MAGEIVPFGKYKGQPVEVLAADTDYCDWLTAQPWFRSRYGNVYNILISGGAEPQETPEHNAMQARFLDDEWCLRLSARLAPESTLAAARQEFAVSALQEEFSDCTRVEEAESAITRRQFEVDGWDVVFTAIPGRIVSKVVTLDPLPACACQCDHSRCAGYSACRGGNHGIGCAHKSCVQPRGARAERHCGGGCPWAADGQMQRKVLVRQDQEPAWWQVIHSGDDWLHRDSGERSKADWLVHGAESGHLYGLAWQPDIAVELKPDLGDDYPAVLRQVTRYKNEGRQCCVVARRHAFEQVGWDQVRDIFAASGVTLIAESELNASQPGRW